MPLDKDIGAAKGYQTHYPNTTTANQISNVGKPGYHHRAYSLEQKSKVYNPKLPHAANSYMPHTVL